MRAIDTAQAIARGDITARGLLERTLVDIAQRDPQLNCFTRVTTERARAQADAIDALRAAGKCLPPLAGVPFAVKNLFDLTGEVTLAGSRLNAGNAPATRDAILVERLCHAGAIVLGALNMDPYAYGFTTENTAYGATRNPHDLTRSAGGSSGGSAAAVAAGFAAFTLGSDTNGSIRVPSSYCGVFGLKPTFGRLSRRGSYPFVHTLDHLGPFATSAADLALTYNIMQGWDDQDPSCAQRPVESVMLATAGQPQRALRVARLTGYFDRWATPMAREASLRAARALGAVAEVELPEVERARAAAFLITASEGANLHLPALRAHYDEFEPHTRDRFLVGALQPASWYLQAQRLRAWYVEQVREVFRHHDVLVAPATPFPATALGEDWVELDGQRLPLRPSVGLLTQPISFAGLPVAAVPMRVEGELPLAVQLIAAPWREDLCLEAAAQLEALGVAHCRITE